MRKWLTLVLTILIITSCVPRYSVFKPLSLEIEPIVEYYSDMNFNYNTIHTFSVVPLRAITKKTYENYNSLAENSIGFTIRNLLEQNGYRLSDHPDIVVLYLFSNKYEQTYVPPQKYTSFMYVPGRTITTTTDFSGNINSITNWGTFGGTTTSTTYLPARIVPYSYTTPGKTVGYYYPGVNIWVYDLKSKKIIWQGFAIGASKNGDVRVSTQLLFMKLLSNFPLAQQFKAKSSKGIIGIWIRILTFDGNLYFPVIVKVERGLPGYEAGLRVGDIILEINGVSTRNKPISIIDELISGEAYSEVTFTILRNGKTHSIQLVRAAED